MKMPRKISMSYQVLHLLSQRGVMTMNMIFEELPHISSDAMRRIASDNELSTGHGTYSLPPEIQIMFEEADEIPVKYKGEIVPPRQVAEFRQISAKYIPSLGARRNDAEPPREIHFMPGGTVANRKMNGTAV